MKKYFSIALFLIIVFLITGCSFNKYTLEKYNQIQPGDSIARIEGILGGKGELMAESTMPAVPGIMSSIRTQAFVWKNPDGSNIICAFQNGVLMHKTQAKLSNSNGPNIGFFPYFSLIFPLFFPFVK